MHLTDVQRLVFNGRRHPNGSLARGENIRVQVMKRCILPPSSSGSHGWEAATGAEAHTEKPSNPRPLLQRLLDLPAMILAGGLAGCAMWATVLPIDAAKTRIQAASRGSANDVGVLQMVRMMWREGGVRACWSGLTPTLLRAFPANAAQWLVWELSISALRP